MVLYCTSLHFSALCVLSVLRVTEVDGTKLVCIRVCRLDWLRYTLRSCDRARIAMQGSSAGREHHKDAGERCHISGSTSDLLFRIEFDPGFISMLLNIIVSALY
jgi:hypothetical protein